MALCRLIVEAYRHNEPLPDLPYDIEHWLLVLPDMIEEGRTHLFVNPDVELKLFYEWLLKKSKTI